jgi:hypothetical protein
MHIYIYVYMYLCIYIYVCMYLCIYIYIHIWLAVKVSTVHLCPFTWKSLLFSSRSGSTNLTAMVASELQLLVFVAFMCGRVFRAALGPEAGPREEATGSCQPSPRSADHGGLIWDWFCAGGGRPLWWSGGAEPPLEHRPCGAEEASSVSYSSEWWRRSEGWPPLGGEGGGSQKCNFFGHHSWFLMTSF